MRQCSGCGQTKPMAAFHQSSHRHSAGHDHYCKPCRNTITAGYREANRERLQAEKRRQYAANLELSRAKARTKFRRHRIRRKSCSSCQDGEHGPMCQGPAAGCVCRCRAMLGLEGPFPFADPTAPGWDVADPDRETA